MRRLTIPASRRASGTLVLEAYGASLAISVPDRACRQAVLDGLPPGWTVVPESGGAPPAARGWQLALLRDAEGYRVSDGSGDARTCPSLRVACRELRLEMRRYVGYHARDVVFIHAGVVEYGGRALLLPGPSFAGKSTLVAALVRAGATYYSDEFAILDAEGRVNQYREPIALRGLVEPPPIDHEAVRQPIPVGLVALALYKPRAQWSPRPLSRGAGVLAMVEHALPVRDRPAETLSVLARALDGAVILEGDRGDADQTAPLLLEALSAATDAAEGR